MPARFDERPSRSTCLTIRVRVRIDKTGEIRGDTGLPGGRRVRRFVSFSTDSTADPPNRLLSHGAIFSHHQRLSRCVADLEVARVVRGSPSRTRSRNSCPRCHRR